MINKLKYKITFRCPTPHTPEADSEEIFIEAYNDKRAVDKFYSMFKGRTFVFEKVEEVVEEKTYKINAK